MVRLNISYHNLCRRCFPTDFLVRVADLLALFVLKDALDGKVTVFGDLLVL